MAALYDVQQSMKVVEDEVFRPVLEILSADAVERQEVDRTLSALQSESRSQASVCEGCQLGTPQPNQHAETRLGVGFRRREVFGCDGTPLVRGRRAVDTIVHTQIEPQRSGPLLTASWWHSGVPS